MVDLPNNSCFRISGIVDEGFFSFLLAASKDGWYTIFGQAKHFYHTLVFPSVFHNVDSGSFNTGMPQDISQLGKVFSGIVKGFGEQMPKVMRKYFFTVYTSAFTQPFHRTPDITAV